MKRQANIELLRIVAMLMIIGSHLALHGVQSDWNVWSAGNRINRVFSSFLKPGGGVGVAVFFMITGYFNVCKEKVSAKRTIQVTIFYGFLCGMIGVLQIVRGNVSTDSIKSILRSFLSPVMGGWWFVTAYILLTLISPTLNKYLSNIGSTKFLLVVGAFWLFEYTVGNITTNQYFQLQRAVMFYLIGAYLRKQNTSLGRKIYYIVGFALTYCLNGIVQYFSDAAISAGKTGITNEITVFASSCVINSVFVIIEAICLFHLFLQININSERIVTIGRSVFGIYLLHDSPFTRNVIWHDIVKIENLYAMKNYPILAFLTIICVFLSCYMFEKIRNTYLEKPIEKGVHRCYMRIGSFLNFDREY